VSADFHEGLKPTSCFGFFSVFAQPIAAEEQFAVQVVI